MEDLSSGDSIGPEEEEMRWVRPQVRPGGGAASAGTGAEGESRIFMGKELMTGC